MFVQELTAIPKKGATFVSGSKELIPLVEDVAASKIRGSFFSLYEALMAANKRCVSLIEGQSHLNERKGLLILATRFLPNSYYTVTSFDAIIGVDRKYPFTGGRGILAFSHLLTYRFLFSAILIYE